MKKKVYWLLTVVIAFAVNNSIQGQTIINLSSIVSGSTIDYIVGSNPQVKNDYQSSVLMTRPSQIGGPVNIPPGGTASVAYPENYGAGGPASKGFFMRCIPDASAISVSVNGGSATISGMDSWFTTGGGKGFNQLYQGSTLIGQDQISYTVTGSGTVTYTWLAADPFPQNAPYSIPVTVTFAAAPPTYTLTVNSGTGSGSYTAGTAVNISANAPPSGQIFDQWTGNTSGIANVNSASTTYTMGGANATITATYKTPPPTTFTYTATAGTGGTIGSVGKVVGLCFLKIKNTNLYLPVVRLCIVFWAESL